MCVAGLGRGKDGRTVKVRGKMNNKDASHLKRIVNKELLALHMYTIARFMYIVHYTGQALPP